MLTQIELRNFKSYKSGIFTTWTADSPNWSKCPLGKVMWIEALRLLARIC